MSDLQEIMGRVIRRERQERRLTLKEVADKANLSMVYVGEVERGQKYPSATVLEKLAEALELTVADLLELVAEEIRAEHEPQPTTSAIGFVLGDQPGQPRQVVRRIVNMLDEGAVASVADFSAYLLTKHFHYPQRVGSGRNEGLIEGGIAYSSTQEEAQLQDEDSDMGAGEHEAPFGFFKKGYPR